MKRFITVFLLAICAFVATGQTIYNSDGFTNNRNVDFLGGLKFENNNGAGYYRVLVSSPSAPVSTYWKQNLDALIFGRETPGDIFQQFTIDESGIKVTSTNSKPMYYDHDFVNFSGNQIPSASWVLAHGGGGDSTIFATQYDLSQVYNNLGGDSVIFFAGVLRPTFTTTTPGSPITWKWIDDTDHTYTKFLPTITQSLNGRGITVHYPAVNRVISFVCVTDETTASKAVTVGATVDKDSATIYCYVNYSNNILFIGNGSTWTGSNAGWSSGVGTISNIPSLQIEGYYTPTITYVGSNNYSVRLATSGISLNNQAKFTMWNNATGQQVLSAPSSLDKVMVQYGTSSTYVGMDTFSGTGVEASVWGSTPPSTANLWVIFMAKK